MLLRVTETVGEWGLKQDVQEAGPHEGRAVGTVRPRDYERGQERDLGPGEEWSGSVCRHSGHLLVRRYFQGGCLAQFCTCCLRCLGHTHGHIPEAVFHLDLKLSNFVKDVTRATDEPLQWTLPDWM